MHINLNFLLSVVLLFFIGKTSAESTPPAPPQIPNLPVLESIPNISNTKNGGMMSLPSLPPLSGGMHNHKKQISPSNEKANLRFDEAVVEKSIPELTEKVDAEFSFTNVGDEPIKLAKVKPGCSCVGTKYEQKTYNPGDSGKIVATYKINTIYGGKKTKYIDIKTEPEAQAPRLSFIMDVPKVVKISKPYFEWDYSREDAMEMKSTEIEIKKSIGMKITKMENKRPDLVKVSMKVLDKDGAEYDMNASGISKAYESYDKDDFVVFKLNLEPKKKTPKDFSLITLITDSKIKSMQKINVMYSFIDSSKTNNYPKSGISGNKMPNIPIPLPPNPNNEKSGFPTNLPSIPLPNSIGGNKDQGSIPISK